MRQMRYLSKLAACTLVLGLAGASPALFAAQTETAGQSLARAPGPMCPVMMGGYGGGYGMGPGMMGGYGGGYGMGPGMMGGYGMGGMMGAYLGAELKLTDAQQAKINKIMDETRKQHWTLMGTMMEQQARLRDLSAAPKPDDAAIGAAYRSLSQMQQQMFDSMAAAQKQMDAVLTKEQREQLHNDWRRGRGPRR